MNLHLDGGLHAIKPPLPPSGFLVCFEEIKSSSDERPVSTTEKKKKKSYQPVTYFTYIDRLLQGEGS